MKGFLLVAFSILIIHHLNAQVLKGLLHTPEGKPVGSATIILFRADQNTILKHTVSDSAGQFSLPVQLGMAMILQIRHLSFEILTLPVDSAWLLQGNRSFIMTPRKQDMKEILIIRKEPVMIKKDTVVYRAEAYEGPDTRKLTDLLAKMQGFTVNADGKLQYNGQMVERLMVDGEDLTGSAYSLITKNLNAGYIDKVEVILNDHENRLMRSRPGQGKVGVNLVIKEKSKGRWSTAADLGLAAESRHTASLNSFLVKQAFKQFSFLNLNNIAEDAMGDADAYEETTASGDQKQGLMQITPVLTSGIAILPDLPEKYVRHNNDGALAAMMAIKPGKYISLRLMAGYKQTNLNSTLHRATSTFPDSSQGWQLLNDVRQYQKSGSFFLKGKMVIDRGKSIVHQVYLNAALQGADYGYINQTTLDVKDLLNENLADGQPWLQAGWKRTRASSTNPGKMGITDISAWLSVLDQDLTGSSSRYSTFFGLPQGNSVYRQLLHINEGGITARQLMMVSRKRWSLEWGFAATTQITGIASKTDIRQTLAWKAIRKQIQINRQQLALQAVNRWVLGGRSYITLRTDLGPEAILWGRNWIIKPGYGLAADYQFRVSQLRSLKLFWSIDQHLPGHKGFLPDSVLSGNGDIMGSIRLSRPQQGQMFRAGYFSNRIHEQLIWSIQGQWKFNRWQYGSSVYTTPLYNYSFEALQGGSSSVYLMGSLEKFVASINSKLGSSFWVNWTKAPMDLNNSKVLTQYGGIQWEGWWIAVFFKVVKWETRLKWYYSKTNLEGGISQSLKMVGGSQKLGLHWSDRGFLSLLWRVSPFGTGKYAQGLDLYVQQKWGKRGLFSLQGHNLLNQGQLRVRKITAYQEDLSVYQLVPRYVLLGYSFQW